jgi:DNA-binding transcriptional MerR regulator
MNPEETSLLSIGSFARITLLSLKALRLYAQLGVLKPAYIDPDSGYRYYRVDQLREARLIRALRQMDMPLATIRQVLAAPPADAERLLSDYVQAMETRVVQVRRMVPDLVSALRREEPRLSLEVNVRTVERQPVVSMTSHVRVDELDRRRWESLTSLSAFIAERAGTVAGPAFGLFHGPINQEDDGPVEVCVPTLQELVAEGEIASRVLSGGQFAYVVICGDECEFPALLKGYDAVYDWIDRNGYEAEGSPREMWRAVREGRPVEMEIGWLFRDPGGT